MHSKRQNLLTLTGLCALLFVHCTALAAEDHQAILEQAMQALKNDYRETWSFTETSTDSDNTKVGRYDVSREPNDRWTLLTIDGRPPTAKETEQYSEDKALQLKIRNERLEKEKQEEGVNIRIQVAPGSVRLLEETDQYYLFQFSPAEDEEGFMEFVEATSKVIKPGLYVEYINLQNTEPFKPRKGVKVKEFKSSLGFGPASEGGPIVPLSVNTSVKARAMLVMNIDENQSILFTNYVANEAAE